MNATPLHLAAATQVSAAGVGLAALAELLHGNRSALVPHQPLPGQAPQALPTWVGRVAALEAPGPQPVAAADAGAAAALPPRWAAWDCRANRLAWLALQADGFGQAVAAACERFGPARVGLVMGTSASTIAVTEQAYRQPAADGGFPPALRHEALNTLHGIGQFVALACGLQGPAVTVSTACSSSAKAFATAGRWLQWGGVDAVVVAGVDSLSDSVLYGFRALQLLDPAPCQPFGPGRQGISVAEGAGLALLQRGEGAVMLRGWGESNDAHHMSSPQPEGLGAEAALDAALAQAGWAASAVELVQLHGTGTALNDRVEAALVARRYADGVHASALKGAIGHTMGAAGLLGTLALVQALHDGRCPGTPGTDRADPDLGEAFAARLQLRPQVRRVRRAACHAFGFGGNNAVLMWEAA